MPDACPHCATVAGPATAPGGPIYDDGLWLVVHHPAPESDPGELFVVLRRHCESLAGLTAGEAASLGPILRAAVTAVERVIRPERVYVASYNERVRHVHFYLLPRTTDLPAGHVASDLYRKARGRLRGLGVAANPTAADRAQTAQRIRMEDVWPGLG